MPRSFSLNAADAAPGKESVAITASDSLNLTNGPCRAIFVGTAGNISLVTPGGTTLVFKNLSSGSMLAQGALRVNATNTTAADLIAIY